MTERIAIAMSGGVDSSVAAHLLTKAGHEGVGISMVIWPNSRCCNTEAIRDAGDVAAQLGIPFQQFDFVDCSPWRAKSLTAKKSQQDTMLVCAKIPRAVAGSS
jgi:PP-loop superfamily ATP-utilizing enzyme